MTERRRHLWARHPILGNAAVICRSRISDVGATPKDEGATPKDDGPVSQMTEHRRHLWARHLILGNAAVICRNAADTLDTAPPSLGAPPRGCFSELGREGSARSVMLRTRQPGGCRGRKEARAGSSLPASSPSGPHLATSRPLLGKPRQTRRKPRTPPCGSLCSKHAPGSEGPLRLLRLAERILSQDLL